MSVNIGSSSILSLRCLGNIPVEAHQFLNGVAKPFRTVSGHGGTLLELSLAPDPPGDGGVWTTSGGGGFRLRFSCFENVFLAAGPKGQVSIASQGQIDASNGGLRADWEVSDIDVNKGHVTLWCNGQYLNGNTVDGSLNMVDNTGPSGTLWEVVATGVGDQNSHIPHENR